MVEKVLWRDFLVELCLTIIRRGTTAANLIYWFSFSLTVGVLFGKIFGYIVAYLFPIFNAVQSPLRSFLFSFFSVVVVISAQNTPRLPSVHPALLNTLQLSQSTQQQQHSTSDCAIRLNIHHFIFILFVLINFKLADVERRSSGNHSEQTPNNFESGGKQFQSHQLLNVVRPRRHCRYRFLVASMMWLCAFFMHIRSWCLSSFLLLWHNRKVISEGNARHLILRRTFHPKSEVFQHENCCYTPPIPMLTENYCDEWDEPRFIHCHVIQFQ